MIADTFLDTDILLQAANGGGPTPDKHAVAQGLLTTNFATSAQVLSEFFERATTGALKPLDRPTANRWIELLVQKPVQPVDGAIVLTAMSHQNTHALAFRDATILAAAETLGCATLYSENLTHDQTYGSVRVINPFLQDTRKEG